MLLGKRYFFALNIHPLLPVTFSLLLGIWWQSLGYSFYIPFSAWLFCIFFSYYFSFHSKRALMIATSFIIGCASFQSQLSQQAIYHQFLNQPIDLEVSISDEQVRDHPYLKHSYTGTLKKIIAGDTEIPFYFSTKKMTFYAYKKLDLNIADTIHIANVTLKKPNSESMNNYFINENILGMLVLDGNQFTKLNQPRWLNHPRFSFWRWIHTQRNALVFTLKAHLHPTTFAFFSLLFLGNKSIPKKRLSSLKEQFKRWGLLHYLARSGLHLVLFVILWELLLKMLPLPFIFKHILLLAITITYFLLTWTSISFFRSYCAFLLYKLGILANRQTNSLHILTVITALLLLSNPMYLFFLDFQLSFGITFLLAWLNQLNLQKNRAVPANS